MFLLTDSRKEKETAELADMTVARDKSQTIHTKQEEQFNITFQNRWFPVTPRRPAHPRSPIPAGLLSRDIHIQPLKETRWRQLARLADVEQIDEDDA